MVPHLIPTNDTQPHTLSTDCACNPEITSHTICHNAFDKREIRERRTGKSQKGKEWKLTQ